MAEAGAGAQDAVAIPEKGKEMMLALEHSRGRARDAGGSANSRA